MRPRHWEHLQKNINSTKLLDYESDSFTLETVDEINLLVHAELV